MDCCANRCHVYTGPDEKAVNFQEQYFRHEIEIYKADEV